MFGLKLKDLIKNINKQGISKFLNDLFKFIF